MNRLLPILLLAGCANFALAKDKAKPKDSDYQPATLVSFRTETTGARCSGNVDATVDQNGQVDGTTSSTCKDRTVRLYTIQMDGQTFTVEPTHTGKQKGVALATLGWSSEFEKGSVLRDQLPGAHIEVRSDPSGVYIRVGKRESKFTILEAH